MRPGSLTTLNDGRRIRCMDSDDPSICQYCAFRYQCDYHNENGAPVACGSSEFFIEEPGSGLVPISTDTVKKCVTMLLKAAETLTDEGQKAEGKALIDGLIAAITPSRTKGRKKMPDNPIQPIRSCFSRHRPARRLVISLLITWVVWTIGWAYLPMIACKVLTAQRHAWGLQGEWAGCKNSGLFGSPVEKETP